MAHSVPSTMRAAYIAEYNKPYALDESRATPKPGPEDLLIRVHAAGFCHSDAQALQGQFRTPSPLGLIPSHEIAGVIAATGASYHGQFKVGDRVGILNFKHACGTCPGCKRTSTSNNNKPSSDPRFCDNRETAGFLHDGGFADYAVGDPETTVRLPDGMSFAQAAPLMCAGATVWGSLERATEGLAKGDTIAIVGVGGLGHLGVQFAKALGFQVIAVDSRQAGRDLAMEMDNRSLQPDLVVDSSDPKTASEQIYRFTNDEGVAAAVVCTDSIAANRWALQLLRIGGTLGLLGLPPTPWQFDADVIVFKELSIRGSYVAGRDATERMLEVVEEAGVRSQITEIGYDRIPEIMELYEDKEFKGRLVVNMAD